MIYPRKIQKFQSSGVIGSDGTQDQTDYSKKTKNLNIATNATQLGLTAGTMAFSAYQSKHPVQVNDLGIGTQNRNEAVVGGALKGAQMGMQAGIIGGPVAGLVGAGAGLLIGAGTALHKNNKERKENDALTASLRRDQRINLEQGYKQNETLLRSQYSQQQNLLPSNYTTRSIKRGGIFPKLKNGGVTPHAVIPSGPLHSEKNNLGTKGLPVVHSETNEKKAEVEREEIIFTKPQSEVLEKFHKELTANPSDEGYIKFGEIIGRFINGAKDMNDE